LICKNFTVLTLFVNGKREGIPSGKVLKGRGGGERRLIAWMAHFHHVASITISAPALICGDCSCISLIPCAAGCKSWDIPRGMACTLLCSDLLRWEGRMMMMPPRRKSLQPPRPISFSLFPRQHAMLVSSRALLEASTIAFSLYCSNKHEALKPVKFRF
jgi:hypothetical protein